MGTKENGTGTKLGPPISRIGALLSVRKRGIVHFNVAVSFFRSRWRDHLISPSVILKFLFNIINTYIQIKIFNFI